MQAVYLITNRDKIVKDHIICTGKLTKLEDIMDKAFKYFDLNWREHIFTSKQNMRVSDISSSFGDPTELSADLHWKSKFKIDDIIKSLINHQQTIREK